MTKMKFGGIATAVMVGFVLSAEATSVALLQGSGRHNNEWDSEFKKLDWDVARFECSPAGIRSFGERSSAFDMALVPPLFNWRREGDKKTGTDVWYLKRDEVDFSAIRKYVENGGMLIVTEAQYLMSVMARYGYPADTPVLTTECFDISETWLPQWDTASYDYYQAGKPTYDWGNREFVQAASIARIYLSVLHDWPRHRMANIWVSTPIVDHDQMPLLLCKVPHTLGRHFDDVVWIGDVRRDADGVRAFVFRRGDGTGVAALWVVDNEVEFGYRRGPTVSLSLPSDTTAYDLMGCRRRLVRKDGVSEIRLTPAPLILRAADPEALLSALDSLAGRVAIPGGM